MRSCGISHTRRPMLRMLPHTWQDQGLVHHHHHHLNNNNDNNDNNKRRCEPREKTAPSICCGTACRASFLRQTAVRILQMVTACRIHLPARFVFSLTADAGPRCLQTAATGQVSRIVCPMESTSKSTLATSLRFASCAATRPMTSVVSRLQIQFGFGHTAPLLAWWTSRSNGICPAIER